MVLQTWVPVRRNFYIWSYIDVKFLLGAPEIIEQIYEESMDSVSQALDLKASRITHALRQRMARLPLALHCLYNIGLLSAAERATIPSLKKFDADSAKNIPNIWRFLTAFAINSGIFLDCFCRLLRLSAVIIQILSDVQIIKVGGNRISQRLLAGLHHGKISHLMFLIF